jgi:hypothetical protein
MRQMIKILKRYILAKTAQAVAEKHLAYVQAESEAVHAEAHAAHADAETAQIEAMGQLAQQLVEQLKLVLAKPPQ